MADNLLIFEHEYAGKPADFDHAFGYQCKDLAQKWVTEVLSLPPLPVGDAWAMLDRAPSSLYTKVVYKPGLTPKPGDIMVWKRSYSPFFWLPLGHISVFHSGNNLKFISFDQNWPTNSLCHLQPHSYTGVAGWLRKK